MSSNFIKVKEFNEVFGHPAPSANVRSIFTDSPKVVKLRNNLINEEFSELVDALENKDLVEIVDALSDILYVAYGLLVVYGVDGDEAYKRALQAKVDAHNETADETGEETINLNEKTLTNFKLTREFCCSNVFGDLILNNSCIPATFFDVSQNMNFTTFNTFILEFETELVNLARVSDYEDFDGVVKTTSQIIYLTYILGLLFGVDLDVGVDLVHSSNMSKLCVSKEETEQTVEWYKTNEKRYDSPNFRENAKGFVIFNESSGKILKNINYKPVDLSALV